MDILNFFKCRKGISPAAGELVLDSVPSKKGFGFLGKLTAMLAGKSRLDEDVLADLEELLIAADVGPDTTIKIIAGIEKKLQKPSNLSAEDVPTLLRAEIMHLLELNKLESLKLKKPEKTLALPYVILVVGVNGVGKTTTIAKLAHRFIQKGSKVLLGGADTFRAAAVDQLRFWADKIGARMVAGKQGADPASVAYDTLESAIAQKDDVVIIDTAGRLHNKKDGLMVELSKIKQVMQKLMPAAPHEILLVLDACTGQNAFEQCKQFTAAVAVNALALTKLDGSAKGGVVIRLWDQFTIPIKYIGVGEGMDDLQLFDQQAFVDALFKAE